MIRAEEDILGMQDEKKKDIDILISQAEGKEIKQRQLNAVQDEKRKAMRDEMNEKFEGCENELRYINKSKRLVAKNIKNAEERIEELNNSK